MRVQCAQACKCPPTPQSHPEPPKLRERTGDSVPRGISVADALEALGVDAKTAHAVADSEQTSGFTGRAPGQRYHDTNFRHAISTVIETLLCKLYRRRTWPHVLESLASKLLAMAHSPTPKPSCWRRAFNEGQDKVASAILDLINEAPRYSIQRRTALSIASVLGASTMAETAALDARRLSARGVTSCAHGWAFRSNAHAGHEPRLMMKSFTRHP